MTLFCGKGFTNLPIIFKDSHPKSCSFDAKFFRPVRKAQRFSVICYKNVVSFVSGLFWFGCPFTIFRRISFVIVNSFNRIFRRWSNPHVVEKIYKRVSPSATNGNPSSTIRFPMWCFGIITSCFHVCPSSILRGLPMFSGILTMLCKTMNFHNISFSVRLYDNIIKRKTKVNYFLDKEVCYHIS